MPTRWGSIKKSIALPGSKPIVVPNRLISAGHRTSRFSREQREAMLVTYTNSIPQRLCSMTFVYELFFERWSFAPLAMFLSSSRPTRVSFTVPCSRFDVSYTLKKCAQYSTFIMKSCVNPLKTNLSYHVRVLQPSRSKFFSVISYSSVLKPSNPPAFKQIFNLFAPTCVRKTYVNPKNTDLGLAQTRNHTFHCSLEPIVSSNETQDRLAGREQFVLTSYDRTACRRMCREDSFRLLTLLRQENLPLMFLKSFA